MTDWQPIDTAPKDGSTVLLRARFRGHPAENDNTVEVTGYWEGYPIERWKTCDTNEDLFALEWAPIPGARAPR
jgi:hypothetical protein